MYVADLNVNSRIICDRGFCDEDWYYAEFVLVTVPITGFYTIHAESVRDTYGYFYRMPFDIRFFNLNLIQKDDDSYGNSQFQLASTLQSSQTYVVLVTTYSPSAICTVNLYGVGPGLLNFTRFTNLSKSKRIPNSSDPSDLPRTANVNFPAQVNYSSSLNRRSPMFCRNGSCANATHYYQSFIFNASSSGTHVIGSASTLDTYGLLYNGTFNPLDPRENLISEDDDGLGNNQFGFAVDLQSSVRYIVVATTFAGNRRGNFTLLIYAPGTVSISFR